ncbi:MAG: hypothetical protein J6Q45_03720 [Alistipes sp.]|nr:hypothetical protein [Alistipes sp.]
MNTRLSQFIDYATGGNKADFARSLGWSPQYLSGMLKDCRIGMNPLLTLLTKYPELNARWLLLGEGAMLTACGDAIKAQLTRLLTIEQYLPVMTAEEQQCIINNDYNFDAETFAKWRTLLAEKRASVDGRIKAAMERQKARKTEQNVQ